VLRTPIRRSPPQVVARGRVVSLELSQERRTEELVIPIPVALMIEGDGKAVHALEVRECASGTALLEHSVAELGAHALE
jgi:hypothetical protein